MEIFSVNSKTEDVNMFDNSEILPKILGILTFIFFLISLLVGRFELSAVLMAAIAILYQVHSNILENNQKNSKFYLEKYIESSKMILTLIRSKTETRRMNFVSAAETADKMNSLKEQVTEKPDKDFFDIYQRIFLHKIIAFFQDKKMNYFFGYDDIKDSEAIEKYKKSQGLHSGPGLIPDDGFFSYIKHIELECIRKIFRLFGDEIKEGLKNSGVKDYHSDDNNHFLNFCKFSLPGLYKYINQINYERKERAKGLEIQEA